MAYLDSSKVDVFPISHARSNNPYARALSEEHITRLLKSITDRDSFVVEYNVSNILTFVLNGYIVSVDSPTTVLTNNTDDAIYGVILVDTRVKAGDKTGQDYFILRGIEEPETAKYLGVQLVPASSDIELDNVPYVIPEDNSFSAQYSVHILKVLQKISGVWQVPPESFHKITSSSVVNIDGGEV